MLQKYTTERFLELLGNTGFTTFNKSAGHYGLSLILGGEKHLCGSSPVFMLPFQEFLGRFNNEKKYFREDYHPPVLLTGNPKAL